MCKGGHVKINGHRVKPAAPGGEGDVIERYLGERFRRVVVSVLPHAQAEKDVARTMYVDETPVQEKVDAVTAIRRARRRAADEEGAAGDGEAALVTPDTISSRPVYSGM